MSRKKLPKGITWFVNHESDERYFNEQDRLGHLLACFENNFEGVKVMILPKKPYTTATRQND